MEYSKPTFIHKPYFLDSRGFSCFNIFPELEKGQINIGFLEPGVVKGLHFHLAQYDVWHCFESNIHVVCARPKVYPWLFPYSTLTIEDSDIYHFYIGSKNPGILIIPPGFCHGYTNIGNERSGLLYWVTKPYDPKIPDEYRLPWDILGPEIWKPENK